MKILILCLLIGSIAAINQSQKDFQEVATSRISSGCIDRLPNMHRDCQKLKITCSRMRTKCHKTLKQAIGNSKNGKKCQKKLSKSDLNKRVIQFCPGSCTMCRDGQWSAWESSPCTKTCGSDGIQTKTRSCDSPSPMGGGNPCVGSSTETIGCALMPCPKPAVITTTETPITTTQLHISDIDCKVDGDCRSPRPVCDVTSKSCMEEKCCSELKLTSGNNGLVNGERTIVSYVVDYYGKKNYGLFNRRGKNGMKIKEYDGKRIWSADGGLYTPIGYDEWIDKNHIDDNLFFFLNWKSDTNSWEISYNPVYQGMMRNKNCTEDCPVNCPSSAWEYFDYKTRSWMKADDVKLECATEDLGLKVCLPYLESNDLNYFAACAEEKFDEMRSYYEKKIFELEKNNC